MICDYISHTTYCKRLSNNSSKRNNLPWLHDLRCNGTKINLLLAI